MLGRAIVVSCAPLAPDCRILFVPGETPWFASPGRRTSVSAVLRLRRSSAGLAASRRKAPAEDARCAPHDRRRRGPGPRRNVTKGRGWRAD